MKYKQSIFEGVPKKQLNKSRFDLSHQWKGRFNPGELIPVLTEEMMPGDEPELSTEYMFRFDGLYYPIMVLMNMRADTYWIPNRILWPETSDGENVGWKRWIAEQVEVAPPTMDANMTFDVAAYNNSILSHMGIPYLLPGATKTTKIDNLNAFPLAAFLAIWDEYERNPLLESERFIPLVTGDNTTAFDNAFNVQIPGDPWKVLQTKWMKDYFTSAIPTPQLGDAIVIPTVEDGFPKQPTIWKKTADGTPSGDDTAIEISAALSGEAGGTYTSQGGASPLYHEHEATIKQLRLAEVLQAFYERIAKVGTRYRDWIKAFFRDDPEPGVVDVPVLIRSTFGRVQITDVMTTAELGDTTSENTANYRGNANLYEPGRDVIKYHCKEHGWLMQILQVNPDTSYGQGIARMWRRSVQTDYPLDIFSGIGDQEILKEEVLYNSITAQLAKNGDTFGYIPRFAEMRYRNNIHTGYMNFADGPSMHLGRIWDIDNIGNYDDLEIDADFVNAGVNSTTVGNGGQRHTDVYKQLPVYPPFVATPIHPIIKAHIFHSYKVNRALPVYSTPGKGI